MEDNPTTEVENSEGKVAIVETKTAPLSTVLDLVGDFKAYYYRERPNYPQKPMMWFIRAFNEEVAKPMNRQFNPYPSVTASWMRKWDKDLSQKLQMAELATTSNPEIQQIIKTRHEDMMLVPTDNEIEGGLRTLGGELINDALHMLREDQELEEVHDPDVLIKRRTYIMNVLNHATRLSQGKRALQLKEIEEKRNTTGFLMGLLSKASSGTMSDEEMALLKTAYTPKTDG